MDILFISNKGSMHRYFRKLIAVLTHNSIKCDIIEPKRIRVLSLLNDTDIAEGVSFEYRRKRVKYAWLPLPEWVWRWKKRRYERLFCEYHAYFSYVYEDETPQIVGVWNGHRLAEFAIKLLARQRGFKIAYFENGLLPNTTTLDFKGVNDLNSLPRNPDFYFDYVKQHGNSAWQVQRKKLTQRHFHPINWLKKNKPHYVTELPEKYIFVPFQVCFDSQVLLNSPHVLSMEMLYQWLENAALLLDDNLCFVIKEHPSDPKKYSDLYKKNSKIVFSTLNTEEIIKDSLATITLNSSVGIESLIFGKPVIVLGNACYKIKGLTHNADNVDALIKILKQIQSDEKYPELKPNVELLDAYLGYLKNEYFIPILWRNAERTHFNKVSEVCENELKLNSNKH